MSFDIAATATKAGKMLPVDFVPVKGSRIGKLAATFDIVWASHPRVEACL